MSFLKRSNSDRHHVRGSPKAEERSTTSFKASFISSLLNIFADKHHSDAPPLVASGNPALGPSSSAREARPSDSIPGLDSPATSSHSGWPSPSAAGHGPTSPPTSPPKSPLPPLPPSQSMGHSASRKTPSKEVNSSMKSNPETSVSLPTPLPLSPRPPMMPPSSTAPAPRRVSVASGHSVDPAVPQTILLCTSSTLPRKMQRPNWSLSDYAIFEKMYTGYASVVSKAWCKRSGEVVCLKQYNLAALGDLHKFQIYREIKLHSSVKHEHIIHLLGAFQQGDQVVMVQEYAEGGDLFLLLHRHGGKLSERQAVELVLQPFLLVLNYLHQQCIAHRDLKPENILFTRNNILKLCDFGLAIDMREERAVTRAGTLEYMAPEVLNCPYKSKPLDNKDNVNLYYSTSVDSWAVGILTYELLVGLPPFSDSHRPTIEEKIRTETPKFHPSMSELARNFITLALQKEAHLRPTVLELLHHPWIHGLKRFSSMSRVAAPPMTPRPPAASRSSAVTRRSMCYDILDDGDEERPNPLEEAAQAAMEAVEREAMMERESPLRPFSSLSAFK